VTIFRTISIALVLLLTACANHEGLYEPACIAYEGDRIELKSGRFKWHRFTDERVVDKDGANVNSFPDYPKSGTYRIASGRLELVTEKNERLDDWFVVVRAEQHYLLTTSQHDTYLESEKLPDCALRLTGAGS
jgi:hypothetical protein